MVPVNAVDKLSAIDPASIEHFWCVPVIYQVTDPSRHYGPDAQGLILEAENVAFTPPAVGCYRCECMWSPEDEARPCRPL